VASEIQRWLIRTSARTMRDEIGGQVKGQVKKALRGSESEPGDSWSTATTEPPHAADEAPECAWCPVCRAARRISQARSGTESRSGPRLSDAADVMAAAVRDALSGIDSILSYRPGESGTSGSRDGGPSGARPPAARRAAATTADAEPPVAAQAPAGAESPVAEASADAGSAADAEPSADGGPAAAEVRPGDEPPAAGVGGDPGERG
jgi:hypothetical protein